MQEIHTVRGAEPVHPYSNKKEVKNPPQTPGLEKQMPEKDFNKTPTKKSVFVLWIISTITLGLYPAIWYLKKSKQFYNLGTKRRLSKTLTKILLIVTILELLALLILPFTITSDMGTFYQNLSSTQIILFIVFGAGICLNIILSLIVAFISRGIINEALEQKQETARVSWFFTLIFGLYYLQYEINRILEDREDTKRKGPWIILIIIILLAVLSAASSFLKII
jgi:hypothetical protein